MSVTTFVWHLWPGRHWPALPHEELQFVTDLQSRGGVPSDLTRPHYTAVMKALRCGLTAAHLLAAYSRLEFVRERSYAARQVIVADPTVDTIMTNSASASVLLPVPMRPLATAAARIASDSARRHLVDAEVAKVAGRAAAAARVEAALAECVPPDATAVALAVHLHHPNDPTLWGDPYVLRDRVTCLSPMGVADLLGERTLAPTS